MIPAEFPRFWGFGALSSLREARVDVPEGRCRRRIFLGDPTPLTGWCPAPPVDGPHLVQSTVACLGSTTFSSTRPSRPQVLCFSKHTSNTTERHRAVIKVLARNLPAPPGNRKANPLAREDETAERNIFAESGLKKPEEGRARFCETFSAAFSKNHYPRGTRAASHGRRRTCASAFFAAMKRTNCDE